MNSFLYEGLSVLVGEETIKVADLKSLIHSAWKASMGEGNNKTAEEVYKIFKDSVASIKEISWPARGSRDIKINGLTTETIINSLYPKKETPVVKETKEAEEPKKDKDEEIINILKGLHKACDKGNYRPKLSQIPGLTSSTIDEVNEFIRSHEITGKISIDRDTVKIIGNAKVFLNGIRGLFPKPSVVKKEEQPKKKVESKPQPAKTESTAKPQMAKQLTTPAPQPAVQKVVEAPKPTTSVVVAVPKKVEAPKPTTWSSGQLLTIYNLIEVATKCSTRKTINCSFLSQMMLSELFIPMSPKAIQEIIFVLNKDYPDHIYQPCADNFEVKDPKALFEKLGISQIINKEQEVIISTKDSARATAGLNSEFISEIGGESLILVKMDHSIPSVMRMFEKYLAESFTIQPVNEDSKRMLRLMTKMKEAISKRIEFVKTRYSI